MERLLALPALMFGVERHDVADLVLAAMLTGEWQALEHRTAIGLGLDRVRSQYVSAEELERALTAFRYERRLIAASELGNWLSLRFLEADDLRGVLRRGLLRERFADIDCSPACMDEVATVIRAEATCAGALAEYAQELLAWHAGEVGLADTESPPASAARGAADPARIDSLVAAALADAPSGLGALEPAELGSRARTLCALHEAYERFCAAAVPEDAVDARLAERRLQWTTVTGTELSFELEGAAREARLRVVHDGDTLAQIAGTLGLEPVHRELELGAAPPELSSELLAAGTGDLIGPWSEHQRWRVLEIDGRFEAESSPGGRLRAREELLSELVERLAAGKAGLLAAL